MITSNIARAIARGKRQAIRTCISVRDNIEGVAAIEFAYLAPVLLVMLLGTIEVSRGISIDRRFGLVTSMVGDLVAREKTIAPSPAQSLFGIMKSAKSIMGAANSDTLKVRIMSVMALTTDTTQGQDQVGLRLHQGLVHGVEFATGRFPPGGDELQLLHSAVRYRVPVQQRHHRAVAVQVPAAVHELDGRRRLGRHREPDDRRHLERHLHPQSASGLRGRRQWLPHICNDVSLRLW